MEGSPAMTDGDNYLPTLLWLKPWYLFSTKHNNVIHINHTGVTLHGWSYSLCLILIHVRAKLEQTWRFFSTNFFQVGKQVFWNPLQVIYNCQHLIPVCNARSMRSEFLAAWATNHWLVLLLPNTPKTWWPFISLATNPSRLGASCVGQVWVLH